MKMGGYIRAADGFTIVEVMIVLAVSALLLVSAAALIDGRQARTEFTTAVHDEQQQLQQIINETASGYYPNGHNFSCSGNAAGPVTLTRGANAQGTNAGCIFLGKALQFGLGPDMPQSGTIGVLPIVGNQYENVGGALTPVLTVSDSVPRAVYPVDASETGAPTSTATTDAMEYGLHVADSNNACGSSSPICYKEVGSNSLMATGIAAFITGDNAGNITAATGDGSTNLQSGTQQLSLYAVKGGSTADRSLYQASAGIGNLARLTGAGNLVPARELLVCIASGGTNQSGLFTIGGVAASGGNGGLNVTLTVKEGKTC